MSAIDINVKNAPTSHPIDHLLRADRLPHILCPGCGIGTVVHSYAHAIANSDFPEDQHVCVSGIGCSGRAAGYVNVDSYHATHGRALPFALGIAVHRPELKVTVISGDGDLSSIGGNHLIHAARRNVNMTVICINHFTYGMTGGQVGPTTPIGAKGTTAPKGAVLSSGLCEIDARQSCFSISAYLTSAFVLVLVCFVVIAVYGWRTAAPERDSTAPLRTA